MIETLLETQLEIEATSKTVFLMLNEMTGETMEVEDLTANIDRGWTPIAKILFIKDKKGEFEKEDWVACGLESLLSYSHKRWMIEKLKSYGVSTNNQRPVNNIDSEKLTNKSFRIYR